MPRTATEALINAMIVYNAILVPIFIAGVLLYLNTKGTQTATIGIILAALSPFIALAIVLTLVKKGVIKPPEKPPKTREEGGRGKP